VNRLPQEAMLKGSLKSFQYRFESDWGHVLPVIYLLFLRKLRRCFSVTQGESIQN